MERRRNVLRPAKKLLFHNLDDPFCEERLTRSGMCPSCGHNPDSEELVTKYFCPDCNIALIQMGCPKCRYAFREP